MSLPLPAVEPEQIMTATIVDMTPFIGYNWGNISPVQPSGLEVKFMVITFTVSLKRHDTLVSFRADRMLIFDWVCRHAADIAALELDCGLNRWSWTPTLGWVQYPQLIYTPGLGMHRANRKPIRHGNAYDAQHPWRYCAALPVPNPLCAAVDENIPF